MTIFKRGDFTLVSGQRSSWKIDCDALTTEDWDTLALMASPILPAFGYVLGIPRGGVPFAKAMRPYRTQDSSLVLIVDDVYTTGGSLHAFASRLDADIHWNFLTVFARNPMPPRHYAIFQMLGAG